MRLPPPEAPCMTDRIALVLALLLFGLIALDLVAGWGGTLFLLRKFADLVDWVAFWR